MNSDEQWLADLLKRTIPQPPRQLTYEEITVKQRAERSRKAWAMPVLAAAAVVAIGVALGAATRHSGPGRESFQPASGQAPASSAATPTALPSCMSTVPGAPSITGSSVTIPDLVGQQLTATEQALAQLGLTMQITTVHASAVPQGMVTRQNPAPGTVVPLGAKVMLYVSAGGGTVTPTAAPTTGGGSGCGTSAPNAVPTRPVSPYTSARNPVTVPSSIGMNLAQAEQNNIGAGLQVVVQQEKTPGDQAAPPGMVWKQNPAAGTTVTRGTTITIVVQPKA